MSMAPGSTSSRAWRALIASTAAGLILAAVAVVACQAFVARQYGANGTVEVGATGYLLAQFANGVAFAAAMFAGTFLAGQVRAVGRLRAAATRRAALLAALRAELDLVPRPPASAAPGDAYRDPLRLLLPARVLDAGTLGADDDPALPGALLALQAAVARYNDLVLTSALVLAADPDPALRARAQRYWVAVERAIDEVRCRLPGG